MVHGIASMIQDRLKEASHTSVLLLEEESRGLIDPSRVPLRSDYEDKEDFDLKHDMSHGQAHVLSLLVQALLLIFIYPLKATLTCRFFIEQEVRLIIILFSHTGTAL